LAISFRPDDLGNWIATPIHECGHICAGTLGFLAPEIVRGRINDIGPASDTAQIGACLYEILTGTPPFLGRDQIESLQLSSRGSFVPILERNPRAPPILANISQRCLHVTPEVRPSLLEIRAVLNEWITNGSERIEVRTKMRRSRDMTNPPARTRTELKP
jgi:serine/threonine protein kinase